MSRWLAFALAFAFLPVGIARAEDAGQSSDTLSLAAKLVLPPKPLTPGEPFHLVIEARHPAGGLALLPEAIELPETIAERRPARAHQRSGDAKSEVDRYDLELIAFEAGELSLPPIALAFGSTRAETPRMAVHVESALGESEKPVATSTLPQAIAELEKLAAANPAPREVRIADQRWAWAAGALVALLVAGLIAREIARRKTLAPERPAPPPPPPRPAHEVALERLEAVRSAGYLAKGELKTFYVEVSEILRTYAGARYGFESVELTQAELSAALRERRTPGLDLARLERLLAEADLVKFAKFVPSDSEAHGLLNGAFEIVERTKPAPAVPQPAEARP